MKPWHIRGYRLEAQAPPADNLERQCINCVNEALAAMCGTYADQGMHSTRMAVAGAVRRANERAGATDEDYLHARLVLDASDARHWAWHAEVVRCRREKGVVRRQPLLDIFPPDDTDNFNP